MVFYTFEYYFFKKKNLKSILSLSLDAKLQIVFLYGFY